MATDYTNRDVNLPYWPGPNAAGMGKATVPPVQAGADSSGMHDTIWNGRHMIGEVKGSPNVGRNALGQPTAPAQPT